MKKWFIGVILALLSWSVLAAVDLNTATQEELMAVNGIGPKRAEAIIQYRTDKGAFKSVDDLENVKGFSKKVVERLRPDLAVSAEGGARKTPTKK